MKKQLITKLSSLVEEKVPGVTSNLHSGAHNRLNFLNLEHLG